MDEEIQRISRGRMVVGTDFNEYEGNRGEEEVMDKWNFAKRMVMTVVKTFLQKREEHKDV